MNYSHLSEIVTGTGSATIPSTRSPTGGAAAGSARTRSAGSSGTRATCSPGSTATTTSTGRPGAGDRGTWWKITTASHIDWPQQARIIEIAADEAGRLFIACTSLDHQGLVDPRVGLLDDPLTLAGWSRELSANLRESAGDAAGRPAGRNVILA